MGTGPDQNALLTGRTVVKSKRKAIIIAISILVVIAIIITAISINGNSDSKATNWQQQFFNAFSATEAMKNSRLFSEKVHVAGTWQNNNIAQQILQQFSDMDIEAKIVQYDDIYLSQYNSSSLSQVNPSNVNEILYQFDLTEADIPQDPTSNTTLRNQAWLAYSPSGQVTGYLVYVNYGDAKDFDVLMNKLHFDLENKTVIALVRYGKLLRGIKALNAAQYGFKAVIVFSDPQDYGYHRGDVVPDGAWLPESGFQRGSAAFLHRCFGNPSNQRATQRCGYDDVSPILPSIPIIPLSYHNAKRLMAQMGGVSVEDHEFTKEWKGGLDVATYKIGTVDATSGVMVDLSVSTTYGPTNISNVEAFIPGTRFSNETILFGAHRDAWLYGAADPISGTVSIVEIARAFSTIYNKGWRPKRNIMFASWDAEEFDLIGSTEYAERMEDTIKDRLVAYFNQDTAVSGPNFTIWSDPLMNRLATQCMQLVTQPYMDGDESSVYDYWTQEYPKMLGSGSDYTVFVHEYGIPAMEAGFKATDYGTYHSVYDSYYTMSHYIDPEYEYTRAIAQVVGCMGFAVANEDVIPFRTDTLYSRLIKHFLPSMEQTAVEYNCSVDDALTIELRKAVQWYGGAAFAFDDSVDNLRSMDMMDGLDYIKKVETYNEAMRTLGSMFLYSDGLPTRKIFKNLIVAPALDNGYGSQVLPFIAYAIKFECDNKELMEKAYNVTANALVDAANYLTDVVLNNSLTHVA